MKRPVLIALALAACSPNPNQKVEAPATEPTQLEDQALGPPSRWLCEDGRTLQTTFYGDRVSVEIYHGETHNLPAVVAASGEAYEADGVRFHAKGMTEAYLQEGEKITNCEASPTE